MDAPPPNPATLPARWSGRSVGVALLFLAAYLVLAWVSYIHPVRGLNITPWNPQSALVVGLLLWRPRAWWLAWIAVACGDALVSTEVSWAAALLPAAALVAGYAATAAALGRWIGRAPAVVDRRVLVAFFSIVCLGALLAAALRVAALLAVDGVEPERVLLAIHRGWVGDGVGLLVTLPLLLMLGSGERRGATRAMLASSEWWLIAVLAIACVVLVFTRPAEEQFKLFYLLFLPVAWSAARFGVTGAAWAGGLVQLLMVLAVQSAPYRPLTVFEFQLLIAALSGTGLLLGATVDEREETARALRASLRLAAAGDMAAALAHELNQPLTALSTYARASQLLAQRVCSEHGDTAQPLLDVTDRLAAEAHRAGQVVSRLRNFFREQATELQLTSVRELLQEAVGSQQARAEALQANLGWACTPPDLSIWLDPVQLALVLRNLVANSLDAVGQAPPPAGQPHAVEVRATRIDNDVVFSVSDSAAGLRGEEVSQVFERRRSDKPGGMGMGLAISRSIVEAHGGRLWAEPGPGGKFLFTLPCSAPPSHD